MSVITTNLPSRKLSLTVLSAVVGLHMLSAAMLLGIKSPAVNVALPVQATSIEIELITLPNQSQGATIEGAAVKSVAVESADDNPAKPEIANPIDAEPITQNEPSERITQPIKPAVSATKPPASDAIKTENIEQAIAPTNPAADAAQEIKTDTQSFIAPNKNLAVDTPDASTTLTPADENTTELELLSGAVATVTTTIKAAKNSTNSKTDNSITPNSTTAGEGVAGEGLDSASTSQKNNAAPITGGYAPFSMAPQSPMAGNIIANTSQRRTNNKNDQLAYRNAYNNTNSKKNDIIIYNYNDIDSLDNSYPVITIASVLPFAHEVIDADTDYAIKDEHWSVAPSFSVIDLMQYPQDDQVESQRDNTRAEIEFRLVIDTKGEIAKITVTKSTGSSKLDQILATDLAQAQLNALDDKGQPLAGVASLTLEIYTATDLK